MTEASNFTLPGELYTEGMEQGKLVLYLSLILGSLGYLVVVITFMGVVYMCITGLRVPYRFSSSTTTSSSSSTYSSDEEEEEEEETPLLPKYQPKSEEMSTCALQGVTVDSGLTDKKSGSVESGDKNGYGSFYTGVRVCRREGGEADGYEADSDEEEMIEVN